jgi:hypothetical protein
MNKLDDISIWIEANRDVSPARWESTIWPEIKQQIKDLMKEVFRSCEHDGSFVSVRAFDKKVEEL